MDSFVDRIEAENNEKLQLYRSNIPNFEPTLEPLKKSLKNIKYLLDDISHVEKQLETKCEAECLNCSSDELYKLLGISSLKKVEDKPVESSTIKPESETINEAEKSAEKPKENVVQIVPQITEDEFKTIPKYQLGRLTLQNLNEIAGKMDEFLMKKSKIIGKSNKQLTRLDRECLDNWRELEMKAKGRLPTALFFIETDIRPLLQERLRPSFPKAVPCLRHIRRIREERCGPVTFYYP